jgi:hypothetical protein
LLKDAEDRLEQLIRQREGAASIAVWRNKVKKRIEEVYAAWLSNLGERFVRKRERSALEEAEEVVARLRAYDYACRLIAAITSFTLRNDIDSARREIDACRDVDDATWKYSEAFLIAYDGDLEGAYRAYGRAFRAPLDDVTVPTQCEEFIHIVLEERPDRPWLYYCLGLINHRAKQDLQAARNDFQRFIDGADRQRFARQIAFAERPVRSGLPRSFFLGP